MHAIIGGILTLALALAAGTVTAQPVADSGPRVVRTGAVNEDLYLAGDSVDVNATLTGDLVAAGGNIKVGGKVNGLVLAAGGNVEVAGEVTGHVFAAGGNVEVSQRVTQDVMAAGGNVEVSGRVDDDVRAAGGSVTVSATVGGDVVAAGGNLTLAPNATVGGRARLAGGTVEVAGNVGGDLQVRGESVRLAGAVRGDVDVEAHTLVVAPGARIEGRLHYASPNEAEIDPAARIAGGVERRPYPRDLHVGPWGWVAGVLAGLTGLLSLFVAATVLRYVFPVASLNAARTLARSPWKSLGLGFALFFCVPAAAIVFFVLVIGVPLGLLVLLLYPLALALGIFVTAVQIAEWLGMRLFGRGPAPLLWQVGLLWLSVLALVFVGIIPWLGQLAQFAALLFGLGGLGLFLWDRYRGTTVGARPY